MVECCNRSIEDVIKKMMNTQQDWVPMLLSVLFAIRTSRHSSTGFTSSRMLYNKDLIMPFQHANKLKHVSDDDEYDSDVTEVYKPGSSGSGTSSPGGTSGSGGVISSSQSDSDGSDDIVSTIQNLDHHKKIFERTHKSIKKAQIHQTKGYNNRQAKGKIFEIGACVLKRNMKDQSHKCSLCRPFNGPYTVIGRSATGYFLHDRFSHQLLCSVPASQLVWFYENHTYKTNSNNTWFETESNDNSDNMSDDSNDDMVFTLLSNCKGQSCQRANIQIYTELQPQRRHKIQFPFK